MDTGKKNRRLTDIDAHLKRAFQELEQEALPERLTGLLDRLRAQDEEATGNEGAEDDAPSARRKALHASAGGGRT